MKYKEFSPKKKDRKKIIRGTVEVIILIGILILSINSIFTFSKYKPYDNDENGFIVISYSGVDRNGTNSLIGTEALESQLEALKDNGYVTITQQDVLDYYNSEKKLPNKALLLLFEDGRRDTALFAQKIMEKYNYKATMLTYAEKFSGNDPRVLMPESLKELVESSYWEMGTNGYRLGYINVFDKEENYIGELNSIEFSELSRDIEVNYNHYLMDFIRDEDNVPKETYNEMRDRINSDYDNIYDIYNKELGNMPILYALMHSNTGQFGTNDNVSEVNEERIYELFSMNFNRGGSSLNTKDNSAYDLTRMQPKGYWSTNHLLMKIWDDTKEDVNFVTGDEEKAKDFEEIKGEAEFKDDTIILTSLPEDTGVIKLIDSDNYKNINLSVELNGNIIGSQGIYLRANEDFSSYVYVRVINNNLEVTESINGQVVDIYSKNIEDIRLDNAIEIKEVEDIKLNIELNENKLNLSLDNEKILENLEIKNIEEGSVFLESAWGEYGDSERSVSDNVYDGVFKELKVTDIEMLFYMIQH